jgi:hypothetical protein
LLGLDPGLLVIYLRDHHHSQLQGSRTDAGRGVDRHQVINAGLCVIGSSFDGPLHYYHINSSSSGYIRSPAGAEARPMSAAGVVWYVGPPEFVNLSAQTYRECGFEVYYKRPLPDRGLPNMGEQVIVGLTLTGAPGGLKLATKAVNKRLEQFGARVEDKTPNAVG